MVKEILLLGNPRLYEISEPVKREELLEVKNIVGDLRDTLMAFRKKHGVGRAIAAPQIGVKKRIFYMNTDSPIVFINPVLIPVDEGKMEVLDDCMSFPNLLVKVKRFRQCSVKFYDMEWNKCELSFCDDLSELVQHEYDHLDGILATMRSIDN